jgi:uncharacterized protein
MVLDLRHQQRDIRWEMRLRVRYWRNRESVHLIIDEADEFAPQRAPAGVERLLRADRIHRAPRPCSQPVSLCA